MDGLSKYISLLSSVGAIASEIKLSVPVSPIAFSVLIDSLNDKIAEIQSIGTRLELDGCLAQMPTAALQSRLDNLSWRDFVSVEAQNIKTLSPTVETKIKAYIKDGKAQDVEAVRNTLVRVAIITKGDIPKAIQYLADTAQRYGYSFNEGTVLYTLLTGYGAKFGKEETKTNEEDEKDVVVDDISDIRDGIKTLKDNISVVSAKVDELKQQEQQSIPQEQVVEEKNDEPLRKYSTRNGILRGTSLSHFYKIVLFRLKK